MWRNGRRVVVGGWTLACRQFAALVTERDALKQELAEIRALRLGEVERLVELQAQCDRYLDRLTELSATIDARQQAERRCVEFYRERDIQRALLAPRDPGTPLH